MNQQIFTSLFCVMATASSAAPTEDVFEAARASCSAAFLERDAGGYDDARVGSISTNRARWLEHRYCFL